MRRALKTFLIDSYCRGECPALLVRAAFAAFNLRSA